MDITGLTYLITIANERSISKASEKLFMAQSSLSQALQSLEAEIGWEAFHSHLYRCAPDPCR